MGNTYERIYCEIIELLEKGEDAKVQELIRIGEEKKDRNVIAVNGLLYIYGIFSYDINKGLQKVNEAIELGCSEIANKVGELFMSNDIGFPINREKALEYFIKGAELGNSESCAYVGIYYLDAEGDLRNDRKAFEYSKRAAEMGNHIGIYNVATCYENGVGIHRSQKDAVYWYKRYLECIPGDTDAMYRISICLTDFLDKFFDVQITKEMYEEAYYYAIEAVENGHIGARIILARFYEMGVIVNQDFQKSYDLIKSAADNGDDFARGLLKRYKKNIFGKIYLV